MEIDKYHKSILNALGHYRESTYSQLFEKTKEIMPKRTFHKKLYELVEGKLVLRDPPSEIPTAHIGKKVKFTLTASGEVTLDTQEFLSEVENKYPGILENILDRSLKLGKAEPLTGMGLHITSSNRPIYTITHFSSKDQAEKLKLKMNNPFVREELNKQIGRTIRQYVDVDNSINEGLYHATNLPVKDVIYFSGFLPKQQAAKIQDLVSEGLFENEYMATRFLFAIAFFNILDSIYNKFKTSQEFKEGKQGIMLNIKYRYDPQNKLIEPLPQESTRSNRI